MKKNSGKLEMELKRYFPGPFLKKTKTQFFTYFLSAPQNLFFLLVFGLFLATATATREMSMCQSSSLFLQFWGFGKFCCFWLQFLIG